ncbi:MAG: tRNA glutamyl-Q(34) synthetase GluQRS [Azospirillum sp.]|nr:tRNA glutamyl-Q(34) synthetase GluQRS [Azospirillum sp.]
MTVVTRFAPSPTGQLHLGHAYSAWVGWHAAQAAGGRFLLRLEDTDLGRCRSEFERGILDDLAWLGLTWETPVRRQSEHFSDYRAALDRLDAAGLLYPCFCTRKDIQSAASAPHGPDGPIYPGTCRGLSEVDRRSRVAAGLTNALRLDVAAASRLAGPLAWHDRAAGRQTAQPEVFGDVVIARKGTPTSYHLSVTVDDHLQGVTLVTRGVDLFQATHVHRLLQALLGYEPPGYHHHRLLVDETGRRLAKRDQARALCSLRDQGLSPGEVWKLAGVPEGQGPG